MQVGKDTGACRR